jgi:hypothetical protein
MEDNLWPGNSKKLYFQNASMSTSSRLKFQHQARCIYLLREASKIKKNKHGSIKMPLEYRGQELKDTTAGCTYFD